MVFEPKKRRTVLKHLAAGGVGAAAFSGLASDVGSAQPPSCRLNCPDGTYVKYEVVENRDGTCSLEEETNTGIFGDSITVTATKEGDSCEPLAVSWDESEFEVTTMKAFGGRDCDTVENPDGSYNADRSGDAGLNNPGGQTAAISNLQFCVREVDGLECPRGTRHLASYDVDGSDITFTGGEDVVTFSNKVTDGSGNLTGVDFASIDGADSNDAPETLTTVTVQYDSTVETFEVDPTEENDKRAGSISVGAPINRIKFCQGTYAQADFVLGEAADDLCTDRSAQKISSITWGSYEGQFNGIQGQFDGSWDIGEEEVTVTYNNTYDQQVVLSVYQVDDPTFLDGGNIDFSETRCRQTLFDRDIDEVGSQDGTLTADFPSP